MRDGAPTSEHPVGACLERIEEAEPEVQAWAHLDPEHALEQARRLDAFFAGREPGDGSLEPGRAGPGWPDARR